MRIADLGAFMAPSAVVSAATLNGMLQTSRQHKEKVREAQEMRSAVSYSNVSNVMANSRVVFTPMSVVLVGNDGLNLYHIGTSEMDSQDLAAFVARNAAYFAELFSKRIAMGIMATQARIAQEMGAFTPTASIREGLEKVGAAATAELETEHLPLHHYKYAFFGAPDATDPSRPVKATMLPDRVLFTYGKVSVASLPTAAMSPAQLQRFVANDTAYFQRAFQVAASGMAKQAADDRNVPEAPVELAAWLDRVVPDWDDTDPDSVCDVLADHLGVDVLDPVLESKILAMASIRNSDAYRTDPVTLEKVLVAFGGDVVDFGSPQFLDNVVELNTAMRELGRYLNGNRFDLSDDCVKYVGDLLFDYGTCVSPYSSVIANNADINAYLGRIWSPAVADVSRVQAWCANVLSPANGIPDSAVLSPEGRELATTTLQAIKPWVTPS